MITFLVVVAAGVLTVVISHLVGGWLLANGLRDGVLRIQEPSPVEGLAVREVGADTITVEADRPRQEVGHPGTIGLRWPSGYGQMGELTAIEGARVTRRFRMLVGEPPDVCPDLEVGDCPQVVVPDPYAFPTDPGDVGLAFSEIAYSAPLGPMGAWVVPSEGDAWAIHVHGWTAERREALRMLPSLHRYGYTSMVVDYRNDPGAPQDPSGHYRFGLTEHEDVAAAVGHAVAQGADQVLLVGYSTGAAHVISFLERSELADRVEGLVLDAPNVMLAETVRHGSVDVRIPGIGLGPSRLLVELGMWIADLRWDVDWETTNYVERAEEIIRVPTLVFHGTSDDRVPISISRRLAARLPDLVRLEEAPAAGHVMSWNADPDRYERQLGAFLDGLQN